MKRSLISRFLTVTLAASFFLPTIFSQLSAAPPKRKPKKSQPKVVGPQLGENKATPIDTPASS